MSKSLQFTPEEPISRSLASPMLFTALEEEVQQRLRDASPQRTFSDGQFIQFHGDRADGFWLIEEGYVRVGQFLPDGGFRAVAVLGMLGALSAQLQDLLTLLAGLRRGNNTARVAGVLANMARHGDSVHVTQQELAELLGVSRATANTALRELESAGLIERGYGGIRLIDREGLALFTVA